MRYITYILVLIFWLGVLLCYFGCGLGKSSSKDFGIWLRTSKIYVFFSGILIKNRREKLLQELSESLAYIRNITLLGRGKSISIELLLEELSEFCPGLRKTYLDMANFMSTNEKEKASDLLYGAIGNSYAKDIGSFLVRWEDIKQEELIPSLESYCEILRQERLTKLKRKDEIISDLVYLPVVLNCMVVLLNFIYVSYFLEQKEALNMLLW